VSNALEYAKAMGELREIVRAGDENALGSWLSRYFKTYRARRRVDDTELLRARSVDELKQHHSEYVRRSVAEGVTKDLEVIWCTESALPMRGSYCEAELTVFSPGGPMTSQPPRSVGWHCPCGAVNNKSRVECRKCQKAIPAGVAVSGHGGPRSGSRQKSGREKTG
jgi:hypothetical protein